LLINLDFDSNYNTHALACGVRDFRELFFKTATKLIIGDFEKFSSEDSSAEKKLQ